MIREDFHNTEDIEKLTYSIPEAVAACGINKDTIYKAIWDGTLKSMKIGRRRLIRVESLKKWLETLEQ